MPEDQRASCPRGAAPIAHGSGHGGFCGERVSCEFPVKVSRGEGRGGEVSAASPEALPPLPLVGGSFDLLGGRQVQTDGGLARLAAGEADAGGDGGSECVCHLRRLIATRVRRRVRRARAEPSPRRTAVKRGMGWAHAAPPCLRAAERFCPNLPLVLPVVSARLSGHPATIRCFSVSGWIPIDRAQFVILSVRPLKVTR